MSSLSDIASETPEVAASGARKFAHFELWGMKIPVPQWAIYCLGALVVIGSGTSAYFKFLQPMLKKEADARLIQYQEYQNHVFEEPVPPPQRFFDSLDEGLLIVKYYPSDGCLQALRRNPGRNQAVIAHWIQAKSIEVEKPPGNMASLQGSQFQGPPNDNLMLSALTSGAPAPVREETETQGCTGGCVSPHQGPFNWWNGEQRGCWIAVWRR